MPLGCFAHSISIQCCHCQSPAVQEVCDSNIIQTSSMCLIKNICLMPPLQTYIQSKIYRHLVTYIHMAARGE